MNTIGITSINTTFKGRSPSLRQADDILRKINNDFPCVSPWHADYRALKSKKIKAIPASRESLS